MSANPSLFDFKQDSTINFMDKLKNVQKDYKSLLGERTVLFVKAIGKEYQQIVEFINLKTKEIEEFKKSLSENIAITDSSMKHDLKFNKYDEELEALVKITKQKLIAFIRDEFRVELNWSLFYLEQEPQDKIDRDETVFDIMDSQAILAFIAKRTNNGNSEDIVKNSILNSLKQVIGFEDRVKYSKNKITIESLLRIEMSYEGKPQLAHGGKEIGAFWKVLKMLEVDFYPSMKNAGFSSIDRVKEPYIYHTSSHFFFRKDYSITDAINHSGTFTKSTKAYKNGKFEIVFHKEEYAKALYENYLKKCFQI